MEVSLDVGSIPTNSTKFLYMGKLSWESVSLQDKILFLKSLAENCELGTFDSSDIHIMDALITGSANTYSGDLGFTIEKHHMLYMKSAWELAIKRQVDDSVTNVISSFLKSKNGKL